MRRLILLLALLLAACSLGQGGENQYYDPAHARFFEGHEGVEMRYDQLPPRLFYYGDAPGSAANDFPVSVEVKNEGSSYTRGAVFLSGYDPNLIQFDEVPIAGSYQGACSLRVGDFSLNRMGFLFQCGDSFSLSGHEGGSFLDFDWLDSVSVRGQEWFAESWLEDLVINYEQSASGDRQIDFVLDEISFGYREHGLLLISILAGLSFEKFLGEEYLLAADSYDYPGGGLEYIEFNGHVVDWPEGTDEIEQRLLLTNCYMYTTFAAPTVCIDPQPYSTNRKVCTPDVATWGNGQGAPVAITRVTQENTPRHAIFHISVENRGRGTVYDPGSLEKCSPYYPGGSKSSDLNLVWIGEARIDDYKLTCTPRNVLRLDESGRGQFTCTYPIEYSQLNSAYQTPLVVELWYGYSESVERRIPIKRIT